MNEVLQRVRPRVEELHLSDNDGRTDAHLWPASGTERPPSVATGTIDWFNLYATLDSLPAAIPAVFEVADTEAGEPAAVSRMAREVLSHAARLRQNTDFSTT
jgi:sugar phosphate isomerase/epimerase